MLKPTITVTYRKRQKDITLHRRFAGGRFEKRDLMFTDFFQVGSESRFVEIRHATGHSHFMRHAMGFKTNQLELAHFDRMIDQLVIVIRNVSTKTMTTRLQLGQRSSYAPLTKGLAFRCLYIDDVPQIFLAMHLQENAGAIKKTMRLIQMRRTYRQIPRIDLISESQRPLAAGGAPAVLVELGES